MHNFGMRTRKVFEYGTENEKEYATDIINKIVCIAKVSDYNSMNYYNVEMRSMVDKELTTEMIDEVILNPHWTMEDVKNYAMSKGWNDKIVDLYFMANMYHAKNSDLLEDEIILQMAHRDIDEAMHKWKYKKMVK